MRPTDNGSQPSHGIVDKKKKYFLFLGYNTSIALLVILCGFAVAMCVVYVVIPYCKKLCTSLERGQVEGTGVEKKVFSPRSPPLLVTILKEEEKMRSQERLMCKGSSLDCDVTNPHIPLDDLHPSHMNPSAAGDAINLTATLKK